MRPEWFATPKRSCRAPLVHKIEPRPTPNSQQAQKQGRICSRNAEARYQIASSSEQFPESCGARQCRQSKETMARKSQLPV